MAEPRLNTFSVVLYRRSPSAGDGSRLKLGSCRRSAPQFKTDECENVRTSLAQLHKGFLSIVCTFLLPSDYLLDLGHWYILLWVEKCKWFILGHRIMTFPGSLKTNAWSSLHRLRWWLYIYDASISRDRWKDIKSIKWVRRYMFISTCKSFTESKKRLLGGESFTVWCFKHAINHDILCDVLLYYHIYMLLWALISMFIYTCRGILALQAFLGLSASQE